jgi:glycine/D-amino acid oxidase-like deaminating enzyme
MPLSETPFWWDGLDFSGSAAEASEPPPPRVDVAIIGGGYTGLSAARVLARARASVVVLERETIGWGASSRNGGQVLTGLKVGASTLLARYGRERARALFASSLAAIDSLEALIADESIDCDFRRCGHLEAAFKPSHFEWFRSEQELLAREFDHHVRLVPPAGQRDELGSDLYHGLIVDERSGSLHPGRFVLGLAAAASRSGARLVPRTDVQAVVPQGGAGGRFELQTSRGKVSATNVLVASNGYTDAAAPALRRRLVPVGSFIVATRPISPDVAARLLPKRRVVFDSKSFLYYFRLSPDDRLLFGGRAQFTVATASSNRRSAAILKRGLVRVFPELAAVGLEYAWSGNVCFAPDLLPHAGRLDGLHFAAGYAGHGVALATFLGARVAEHMLGRGDLAPFGELPFPPIPLYRGRPWFLPAAGMWYKLRDWIS